MIDQEFTGHLLLMMAPMGSGKSMLVRHTKENYPAVYFSVSCTTRSPRPNEIDGVDYYFISKEEFRKKIDNDEFVEWAEFSGNLYGTLKTEILDRLANKQVVLTEIEIQGIEILKPLIPEANRTILYIEAGGWEVLKRRAQKRAPMSEEELALRYERYEHEIKVKALADKVINNFDGEAEVAKRDFDNLLKEVFLKVNS